MSQAYNKAKALRQKELERLNRPITTQQVCQHFDIPAEAWEGLPTTERITLSRKYRDATPPQSKPN